MNLEMVIILTLLTVAVVVVGTGLALFEIIRRVKLREAQYEYEKSIYAHPAGKGLRSEEDTLNDR